MPACVWPRPAQVGAWPQLQRGIEAEVGWRRGQVVDAQQATALDQAQAKAPVDAMWVSIEIVDTHWAGGVHSRLWPSWPICRPMVR